MILEVTTSMVHNPDTSRCQITLITPCSFLPFCSNQFYRTKLALAFLFLSSFYLCLVFLCSCSSSCSSCCCSPSCLLRKTSHAVRSTLSSSSALIVFFHRINVHTSLTLLKLTKTSWQISLSSFSILTRYSLASTDLRSFDSCLFSMDETMRHDERRAPTTFLYATESRLRSCVYESD